MQTKTQEPPSLQTWCTQCNHLCDHFLQSTRKCAKILHTMPQWKIVVSQKTAYCNEYYNMRLLFWMGSLLNQFVIGEFWIVLIRHRFHVYFVTRQRNLIVIILNSPIWYAIFCFPANVQFIFAHIRRIEWARPVSVYVSQRQLGFHKGILVGPIHAELGTVFISVHKKRTTPPQKHSKPHNAPPRVFPMRICGQRRAIIQHNRNYVWWSQHGI